MGLLEDLTAIHEEIKVNPKEAKEKTRRHFWRIVGKIKRQNSPDDMVIQKAAEIRDLLYAHKLGKPRSLKWLILWFTLGTFGIIYYIWQVLSGLHYTGDLLYDLLFVLSWPASIVAGVVFLFYPFGRLIAGKITGIRLDGITRDIYYLPTLKINYETYLKASPPKRQWFFFFAGYWTAFTAIWVGSIGFLLGGEWLGITFGVILAFLETLGAIFGGKWAGELGHFHRERRIVRDWKRNLTTAGHIRAG